MKRKTCHYCGGSRWGLIRYRRWMHAYCSQSCKRLAEKALEEEVKRRKRWLQYLAG